MAQIILIFHMLFAVILIGLVLLQKGKGASMGAAFGSGASQTVFGSKGSLGFLVKLTVLIAGLFFATSIALTYLASHQAHQNPSHTLLKNVEQISKSANALHQATTKVLPAKTAKTQKKTTH